MWVTSYQLPIVKSMTGQVALRETSRVGLADFLAQSMAVEFDVLILDAERELELYQRKVANLKKRKQEILGKEPKVAQQTHDSAPCDPPV